VSLQARLAADPVGQAIDGLGYQVVEKPARSGASSAPIEA
jgi:hypothetical protein